MDSFMSSTISVSCPVCGSVMEVTLRDVQQEATVRCPSGHQITLRDEGDGARQLDQSLRELDRSFKKLNRTIRLGR